MDILIVLVFVSVVFVCAALLLFFVSLHQRDFEHAERLSLLPLMEPDSAPSIPAPDVSALNKPVSAADSHSLATAFPQRP